MSALQLRVVCAPAVGQACMYRVQKQMHNRAEWPTRQDKLYNSESLLRDQEAISH